MAFVNLKEKEIEVKNFLCVQCDSRNQCDRDVELNHFIDDDFRKKKIWCRRNKIG